MIYHNNLNIYNKIITIIQVTITIKKIITQNNKICQIKNLTSVK